VTSSAEKSNRKGERERRIYEHRGVHFTSNPKSLRKAHTHSTAEFPFSQKFQLDPTAEPTHSFEATMKKASERQKTAIHINEMKERHAKFVALSARSMLCVCVCVCT
jgi:hypothetical protein